MKIVFDLLCSQPSGTTSFHGGGEYAKIIFKSFIEYSNDKSAVIICYDTKKYIDKWITDTIDREHLQFFDVKSFEMISMKLEELSKQDEVTFFAGLAYAYKDITLPLKAFKIGTCHGLRAVEKPNDKFAHKYFGVKGKFKPIVRSLFPKVMHKRYLDMFEGAIRNFDVVITDSRHSEYSIKLNYDNIISGKRMYVFYPLTQSISEIKNVQEASDEKYIMMISADRWIKNSYRGIKALDELCDKGLDKDIRIHIYGNYPHKLRKKIKHKDRFKFFEYVSSIELEEAYKHCKLLLYPTLNEGFGNVPMEAMKYGRTCVVSAVCSLTEVYGDSVYYCNPYDLMEIQNRVLQAVDNPKEYSVIEERLLYLQKRQNSDLMKLCKLIKDREL